MKLVLELLEFLIGREALVKLILMFSDLFFEELKTKLTNILHERLNIDTGTLHPCLVFICFESYWMRDDTWL